MDEFLIFAFSNQKQDILEQPFWNYLDVCSFFLSIERMIIMRKILIKGNK